MRSFIATALLFIVLCKDGYEVVGSNEIRIEDAPYMAYIVKYIDEIEAGVCEGTIISEWHILTAKRCLTYVEMPEFESDDETDPDNWLSEPQDISVVVGNSRIDDFVNLENVFAVKNVAFEENNDIAIIELDDKIVLDGVLTRKVNLLNNATYVPQHGTKCRVEGWDKDSDEIRLFRSHVNVSVGEECEVNVLDEFTEICAMDSSDSELCLVRSGGPLMLDDDTFTQIGIFLHEPAECIGINDGDPIYFNVAAKIKWIQEVLYDSAISKKTQPGVILVQH
ncbi:Serine protease 57 [Pseudolycoriella hygida]|uniref:Serine protease 57 n=1 Tax=Pseudolycoriella hygida TaxID=35572 RepID=A0A9Q0MMC5_9DIPT|nr:Serine protease 57 [Pseudolycoriella hygida]